MVWRVVIFLVLNFAALAIGGLYTGDGVSSDWYAELNKAPWTPPDWVFGAAWTSIMICFSFFMSALWASTENKVSLISLYASQWFLNVLWNPMFFAWQDVGLALVVISSLTLLVGYYLFTHLNTLKAKALLVAPYFIWLLIATSLNAYILLQN